LNCRSIKENGFLIADTYNTSGSGGIGWNGYADEAKGYFREVRFPSILAALMFENDDSDMFVLILEADPHGRLGVAIIIPYDIRF
jgi:hypothetical protein